MWLRVLKIGEYRNVLKTLDLSRLLKSFINCSRPRTFRIFFLSFKPLCQFFLTFSSFLFYCLIYSIFFVTILLPFLLSTRYLSDYTNILSETTRNLRPVRYAISTILNLVYLKHKRKQTSSLNERCCLIHSLLMHAT